MDRAYKLKGVEHVFTALTGLRMTDPVPPRCHYKPLLRSTLVLKFKSAPQAKNFEIDIQTGLVHFSCYSFSKVAPAHMGV